MHTSGTFTVTLFSDTLGTLVRELDGAHDARLEWLAPTQGMSYSFPDNSAKRYDYPQGGSLGAPATLTVTGLHDKVPGQPVDAGRLIFDGEVVFVTPEGIPVVDTDPVPSSASGPNGHDTVANRCAALTHA